MGNLLDYSTRVSLLIFAYLNKSGILSRAILLVIAMTEERECHRNAASAAVAISWLIEPFRS
jgi:hypothetical protein